MSVNIIEPRPLEEFAAETGDIVFAEVQNAVGEWRSDAWDVIVTALVEEGEFVSEASPCALCTYEHFIYIAVSYLDQFPDPHRIAVLQRTARRDLRAFHAFSVEMERRRWGNFDDEEYELIRNAFAKSEALLQELDQKYPGTL